jgi:hypothetical protein
MAELAAVHFEAPSLPRRADAGLMDRVVIELRAIERRSGIQRTLSIGELILSQFFANDPERWRDRRRNKNNSIRRLADRADCPFCKSALNEAVAIYVAVRELPCVQTFGHIGASHVASVLTLPEELRLELLQRAEREGLSVRQLRKEVVHVRRAAGERRGRPAHEVAERALVQLETQLRKFAATVEGLKAVDSLDSLVGARLSAASETLSALALELATASQCTARL